MIASGSENLESTKVSSRSDTPIACANTRRSSGESSFQSSEIRVETFVTMQLTLGKRENKIERRTIRTADLRDTDRKSTRLNSSHVAISYAVFCLKKKKRKAHTRRSRR